MVMLMNQDHNDSMTLGMTGEDARPTATLSPPLPIQCEIQSQSCRFNWVLCLFSYPQDHCDPLLAGYCAFPWPAVTAAGLVVASATGAGVAVGMTAGARVAITLYGALAVTTT